MTPASLSPATPSDFSTSWQNWCVVAIVAASKLANASRRLRCRVARWSSEPLSRCATTWLSPTNDGVVESLERVDNLIADPLPQLLTRGAAERDEQHLVERRRALGDIPRHQPRQRERLAGPCAGFQHGGRVRYGQRAQQIEAVHHTDLSARSIGSHTRSE